MLTLSSPQRCRSLGSVISVQRETSTNFRLSRSSSPPRNNERESLATPLLSVTVERERVRESADQLRSTPGPSDRSQSPAEGREYDRREFHLEVSGRRGGRVEDGGQVKTPPQLESSGSARSEGGSAPRRTCSKWPERLIWRNSIAVALLYFEFGIVISVMSSSMPEFRQRFGLTDASLGLFILCSGMSSLVMLRPMAILSRYISPATLGLLCVSCSTVLECSYPWAARRHIPPYPLVMVDGAIGCGFALAFTMMATAVEAQSVKPLMSRLHSFWSIGATIGAAIYSALRRFVDWPTLFPAFVILNWFLVLLCFTVYSDPGHLSPGPCETSGGDATPLLADNVSVPVPQPIGVVVSPTLKMDQKLVTGSDLAAEAVSAAHVFPPGIGDPAALAADQAPHLPKAEGDALSSVEKFVGRASEAAAATEGKYGVRGQLRGNDEAATAAASAHYGGPASPGVGYADDLVYNKAFLREEVTTFDEGGKTVVQTIVCAIPVQEKASYATFKKETTGIFLALALLSAGALLVEGTCGDWTGLFLMRYDHVSLADAPHGFASYTVGMTVARLVGDEFVHRFTAAKTVFVGSVIATVAYATFVFSRSVTICLIALFFLGVGLSNNVPVIQSTTARLANSGKYREALGDALSLLEIFNRVAMIGAPSLIGFIAHATHSLRVGLLSCPVTVLAIVSVFSAPTINLATLTAKRYTAAAVH